MNNLNEKDRILLLQALEGTLNPQESAAFAERRRTEPALQEEYDRMRRLDVVVADAASTSFGPSFADRVMQRMTDRARERADLFGDLLSTWFARIAPVAAGLAVVLGVYNVAFLQNEDQSAIEAALGLPSVTVASAYDSQLTPFDTEELPVEDAASTDR